MVLTIFFTFSANIHSKYHYKAQLCRTNSRKISEDPLAFGLYLHYVQNIILYNNIERATLMNKLPIDEILIYQTP